MTTQSRRLRFTDKFGERKPKADLHLSIFDWKALGCESPIKSRIACGGQQAETLPWRLFVRGFRSKTISLGRLREVFGPQQLRWGDCARFSRHRLSGGPIVRGFRPKTASLGRLREVFRPQTFRWADCARFSGHRLPGGVIA